MTTTQTAVEIVFLVADKWEHEGELPDTLHENVAKKLGLLLEIERAKIAQTIWQAAQDAEDSDIYEAIINLYRQVEGV